jgi:type VI secretion system protein ImpA
MALYEGIEKEVSADAPCGPDTETDLDVQNFLAVAEGHLPASYREFDRKSFEAKPTLERLKTELEKSRDVRFLVLAAKHHMLSDDIAGFADAVVATHALLSHQWEHCHPTEAAGGAAVRSAYLQSLDDLPTIVLPLQYATLVVDKRFGTLTMRQILIANGKLATPDGETALGAGDISEAFSRFEPLETLIALRDRMRAVQFSLRGLRQIFIDKADYDSAPDFDRLSELVGSIEAYVDQIVIARQPAALDAVAEDASSPAEMATESEIQSNAPAASVSSVSLTVRSVQEASNALSAMLDYYARNEPSSPARLLLKQANQLVGKSFLEAMKILAPALVDKVKIQIGGTAPFALTFAQLDALTAGESKAADDDPSARTYEAKTRSEATALIQQVEQFYRSTEPSSPIPMLLEKARNLVAKDFNTLLKEIAQKEDKA